MTITLIRKEDVEIQHIMEWVDLPPTDIDKIYNLTQLSSCAEDRATIVKYFVAYLAAKVQYALSGHASGLQVQYPLSKARMMSADAELMRFFEADRKSADIGAVTYDNIVFKAAVKDHLVWLFPGLLVHIAMQFNSVELKKAKEYFPMHMSEYW